jgi:hypothetical protein
MKKVFLLLVILLVALPLSARSRLEFSPRGTIYFSREEDDVNFGIGADIIVNPKKSFGFRTNLAEIVIREGDDDFSLNGHNMYNFTNFDILYYTKILSFIKYLDIVFGLYTEDGNTAISVGGGIGIEKHLGKGNYIFAEPTLLFVDEGDQDDDLILRATFGIKIGF